MENATYVPEAVKSFLHRELINDTNKVVSFLLRSFQNMMAQT
jgi:hypothetical protein